MRKQKKWAKDEIPNEDLLYCYIHKCNLDKKTKQPLPRAFQNTPFEGGTDLSADWNHYTTAEQSRARLALQQNSKGVNKNPLDYFISQLNVGRIRTEIGGQKVEHDPVQNDAVLPDNRSHSKIIGEKNVEERLKFIGICEWAIAPPQNNEV